MSVLYYGILMNFRRDYIAYTVYNSVFQYNITHKHCLKWFSHIIIIALLEGFGVRGRCEVGRVLTLVPNSPARHN